MNPVRTLLKKELLDIVRDRRTLIITLLLPMLLYPGLLLVMGVIIDAGRERLKNEQLVVALVTDDAAALMARAPTPEKTTYQRMTRAEAEAAVRDREQKVAAAVDAPVGSLEKLARGEQAVVTVLFTRRYDKSEEGKDRVTPVLEALSTKELEGRLEARELDAGFAVPLKTDEVDLEIKDLGPLLAASLLPTVLLMMLLLGALYPAVDLTAGERERGTLETLLVAAVRPLDIMAAKYLAVTLVAVVTALANLGSMAVVFGVGLTLGGGEPITLSFSAAQVTAMVLSLVPTAFLLSAVSLGVGSLARTFKEGQSLMTPVLLVGVAPALIAQMPGIELTPLTALVPLLNVALLVKGAALGNVEWAHVGLTFASVAGFSVLAVWGAAKAFQRESFRTGTAPRK